MSKKVVDIYSLTHPPLAGDYPEVHYDVVGLGSWFLFRPSDEPEWVGVFGWGTGQQDVAAHDPLSGCAFVIACGRGYVVDTGSRRLLSRTDESDFVDVLVGPDPGLFIVSDGLSLYGYGAEGRRWITRRISLDGLNDLRLVGRTVLGTASDLEWDREVEFECDIDSGDIRGVPDIDPNVSTGSGECAGSSSVAGVLRRILGMRWRKRMRR